MTLKLSLSFFISQRTWRFFLPCKLNLHANFCMCSYPYWTLKRASGKSHSQVVFQAHHATFRVRAFLFWNMKRVSGKSQSQVVLQAHLATFLACTFLYRILKRASEKSRSQVGLQNLHTTSWTYGFSYPLKRASGKSRSQVVFQAHDATFGCMCSHTRP